MNKRSIIKYGKTFLKIRLYHNDLPIKQVFKINSITVVIKSLIEKNNKYCLELLINHCLYKL